MSPDQLKPKVPDYSSLAAKEADMREKQTQNFDKRHQAQSLRPLVPGDSVWLAEMQAEGTVE